MKSLTDNLTTMDIFLLAIEPPLQSDNNGHLYSGQKAYFATPIFTLVWSFEERGELKQNWNWGLSAYQLGQTGSPSVALLIVLECSRLLISGWIMTKCKAFLSLKKTKNFIQPLGKFGLLSLVKRTAATRAALPFPTSVCSISLCVQTVVWLPGFGVFNVQTDVDACDCTQWLHKHHYRVCTESWLWGTNPLLLQGIDPKSFCAQLCFLIQCFTNWAVPTLFKVQRPGLCCPQWCKNRIGCRSLFSSVQSKMVSVYLKKPKHALHPAFQKFQCCLWNRLSIRLIDNDSGLFSSSSEVLSEVRLVINACFVF